MPEDPIHLPSDVLSGPAIEWLARSIPPTNPRGEGHFVIQEPTPLPRAGTNVIYDGVTACLTTCVSPQSGTMSIESCCSVDNQTAHRRITAQLLENEFLQVQDLQVTDGQMIETEPNTATYQLVDLALNPQTVSLWAAILNIFY